MAGDFSDGALIELLAWYREMGVGDVVADTPIDWLGGDDRRPGQNFAWPGTAPPPPATSARAATVPAAIPARISSGTPAAPAAGTQTAPPLRRFPTAPPDAAETTARTLARGAGSLAELEAALQQFDGCALKATAKSLCFYRGSPQARVMIVGEAPGREEDLAGKPFVGRAGQLLDKMLAAIALDEATVHITNIVYWRPPGNRTPTPQEAQVCRPFLERQFELVAPDILLLLGGPAAKAILDTAEGIMKLRGTWRSITVGGRIVPVMPTLHPAYLLRTPAAKRQAWRDLLAVRRALDGRGV